MKKSFINWKLLEKLSYHKQQQKISSGNGAYIEERKHELLAKEVEKELEVENDYIKI